MRLSRIILVVVVLLLLAGGTIGALFFRGPIKQLIGLGGDVTAPGEPPPKKVVAPEDIAYADLPDIMVTLDKRSGHGNQIVRLAVSLELDDKADQPRVNAYVPRVIDVFQVYFRQLAVEDLAGPAKLRVVRDALLPRLNAALAPSHVDDVLFREVVVQ